MLFRSFLGAVYLIAFASLSIQITGLVGSHGILPIAIFIPWMSDSVLLVFAWGGVAASTAVVAGLAYVPVLFVLWLSYLWLTIAGQVFLEFQWDTLLLETGLLACLYAPLRAARSEPPPIVRRVLWFLAFKLTFLSGITKLLSGDPTWRAWTALTYHYEKIGRAHV